jgi:flagellar hook-associated protein 1
MPNISSLYTSLSALQAQQKVMDVTSHNVANASTPGYHRQRVELKSLGAQPASGLMSGSSRGPYGVAVVGVTRSADAMLEARVVREEGGRASADLTATTMSGIEGIFPEPTDVGLGSQLDAFWGAWTAVATNPGDLASRTQLLQTATTLATSLNRTSADLTSVRDTAVDRVGSLASEVNDLAGQVASLNGTIASSPGSLDLIDQRDLLVTSIAKLTGANAVPSPGGQVDVYVNGRAIVSGTRAFALESASGTDAGPPAVAFAGRLQFAAGHVAVNATSGEAAALAATITDIVPRYLGMIDTVASSLVTGVNALHTQGYDQNSVIGGNFFKPAVAASVGPPPVAGVPVTAANIALDANVAGKPGNIAAGAPIGPPPSTAPGALDGEQARAIALLADSATGPDSNYHALIAGLAVETQAAGRRADIQSQVADTAQTDADSVGAVSIDEEMANLVSSQRAFEASAKVLTAIDDMIAFLIERTGMVGR